ncbi:MAG: hypothetical protein MJ056_06835 [Akkermansia sp.]|nr:hypothetical protein [Akkermansia sp.]
MKLHLPKKLTAALLAACTALALNTTAAAATTGTATFTGGTTNYDRGDQLLDMYLTRDLTTGTATSSTLTLDNAVNIYGGNFFAKDFTISIWVDSASLSSSHLLFAYGNNSNPTADWQANGLYWDATNKALTLGDGKVTGGYTTFNFQDNGRKITTTISDMPTTGLVNITLAVHGASKHQEGTVYVNGSATGNVMRTTGGGDFYNGNMNGNSDPMGLYVGSGVTFGNISITDQKLTDSTAIYALMGLSTEKPATSFNYVWKGDKSAVWDTETENWVTKDALDTSVPFQSGDNNTVTLNADGQKKEISLETAASISKLTVEDTYKLTIAEEASLTTGTLVVNGTLTLDGAGSATVNKVTIAGTGAKLSVNGEGRTMNIADLTNNGVLDIGAGATVNYTPTEYSVSSGQSFKTTGDGLLTFTTLKVAGGTLDIASDLKVTGGDNGKGGNNSKGLHLSGDGATVNINDGTTTVTGAIYTNANNISLNVGTGATDAKLVTRRLEIGDRNGGAATFHVGQHGTVVITGNEDYRQDTNNPQKNTSLQLAEWNQIVSINIEGKLYSKDATAFMSNDASSSIAINGGTMAVKGIANSSSTSDRAHTLTMTGGKIVLGERGLAAEPGNWTVTLNSGEIGMYADTVVGRNANITGAVTFNTAKYVWSDNQTLAAGVEGGTMTVSANLTGTGTITKTGAGELILSGAGNALTHTLQVKAGKLTLSGSIAIDDIEDGDIDEGYVTAGGEKKADGNGFAYESGILNVYNVEEGAELVNNGSFTYGGVAVTVDQDGKYALEYTVDRTTLWVNSGSESYDAYYTASESALTTAKVAGGATLAIGTNAVGTLAFKENGTTINVTGTGTVNAISGTGTLNLEDNAVVTLAPQGTPSAPTLSGAGTLVLAPSANVNCTITSFDEDWTGTLEINGTNGTPTLYLGSGATAKAGNLHMAAGAATIRLNGGTAKAVKLDEVVMEKGTKLLSFYANYDGENYPSVNMSIGTLTMKGDTATVGTTNHGGLINIGTITGSGTLTLTYESSSDAKTVLNLGGEDVEATTFHGTLDVYHNNNGNKRTTTLILNDEYTAADAVVQFRAINAGSNRALGIGLHAGTVKVAGLNDGTIGTVGGNNLYALYSGDYTRLDNRYDGGADFYEKAGDGETRTLEITGDGEYSTAIKVLGHVNLLMTGTGTQTFTGDMSEFNGTLTLESGTVVVNSALGEDAVVTVKGDATLGGDGIDAAQVGIAADKTATFEQGITDASGVEFLGEEGVQVKNTNEAGGAALLYDITKENAKVTAAMLYAENGADVTVANKLEVGSIVHMGTGALTLTRVDEEALKVVSTSTAEVIIQNAPTATLADMTIGAGGTVAVYQGTDAVSSQEGTVTVTETLTAGGGTLLANLVLAGGSTLDLQTGEGAMAALTLGSNLAFVDGGLVILDATTLAKLDGLVMGTEGNYLELVHAATGTTLAYGEDGTEDYNGMWFGQLFDRPDTLIGDFKVVADETSFGLTKVSNVPEPTTGTLSLLALMALAARRRRK